MLPAHMHAAVFDDMPFTRQSLIQTSLRSAHHARCFRACHAPVLRRWRDARRGLATLHAFEKIDRVEATFFAMLQRESAIFQKERSKKAFEACRSAAGAANIPTVTRHPPYVFIALMAALRDSNSHASASPRYAYFR